MRALVVLVSALVACSPRAPERKTVSLRMSGGPADARVTIDDEIVGTLDIVVARGVALPLGQHRISVERPGFFPCDKLVNVKDGDPPVRVECKLVPVPD
jgi:hypothetical protein